MRSEGVLEDVLEGGWYERKATCRLVSSPRKDR